MPASSISNWNMRCSVFGPFRIARVGRDLAATLDRQRRTRQIFAAGGDFPQHFSFQRQLRLVHRAHTNTVGGEPHLVDRFLRHHDAGKRIGLADHITEQLALAVVAPWHVDHLRRNENAVGLGTSHQFGGSLAQQREVGLFALELVANDLGLGAIRDELGGILGLQLGDLGFTPTQLRVERRVVALDKRIALRDVRPRLDQKFAQEAVRAGSHHRLLGQPQHALGMGMVRHRHAEQESREDKARSPPSRRPPGCDACANAGSPPDAAPP